MATDLTRGSIPKNLIALSAPVVAANLLHSAYAYVDMICVGRLGREAVAAVALSMSFSSFFGTLTAAFNKSVVHFVSHRIGEKDYAAARETFTRCMLVSVAGGLFFSLLFFLNAARLLGLLIDDGEVIRLGVQYFTLTAFGHFFFFPNRTVTAAFRADGDTKTVLKVMAAGNVLNAFLDIVLIFGYLGFPKLGIRGAGFATLISKMLTGGFLVGLSAKGWGNIRLELGNLRSLLDKRPWKAFFNHFLPGFFEGILRGFNQFFILKIISPFGAAAISAYAVSVRIAGFFNILSQALGLSSGSMTGQNLGASKPERAWQSYLAANKIYLAFALLGIGIIMVWPQGLMRIFIQDEKVVALGTAFLRMLAISILFYGLISVSGSTLNAAGNSIVPMYVALAGNYLLQIPMAFLLSRFTPLGINGIWIADPSTHVIQAVLFIAMFRSGYWLSAFRRKKGL